MIENKSFGGPQVVPEFADWCHRVGEDNPRPVTLTCWLQVNYPAMVGQPSERLAWDAFRLAWTTYRRHF